MSSVPTIEQFLSQPYDPEEDEHAEAPGLAADPLERIASSLESIVGRLSKEAEDETEADRWREAHDDLDAKHLVLMGLVLEIEDIIKPSTSKLANTVREAIGRWRGTEPAPVEPVTEVEPVEAPKPQVVCHLRGEADLVGACGESGSTTKTEGYVTCPACLAAMPQAGA